jgi:hypothetical protein
VESPRHHQNVDRHPRPARVPVRPRRGGRPVLSQLDPDGPAPGTPLAVWDNDGIVNTASMLWPDHENTMLIAADHLDIVGHYALRLTIPSPDPTGRRYASYDALRSHTHFTPHRFADIWTNIFDFCVS